MPTIYRIIRYEGPQEWIDETLDQSFAKGERKLPQGTITGATIDPEDELSVTLVRNKFRELQAKLERCGDKGFG